MSGVKILGGILALIGGVFVLLETIRLNADWALGMWPWLINLLVALMALLGGIFGIKGQRGAGFVALIVGLLSIILGIVYVSMGFDYRFFQYSMFASYMNIGLFYGISLEAILITLGGLIIVVSGSED
ncbi:MAG: hypothetical protein HWN65_14915 [Candidatus Helarchaeota archaeon]|nr:hypothetical protein [Candidatus Helarchaeota archaeon]